MRKFWFAIGTASALATFCMPAHANEKGSGNTPTGYVLCSDGVAIAFEIKGDGFGKSAATEECNLRHGGVAAQTHNPKTGATFWDAPRPVAALPKDRTALPAQAVPEVAVVLKGLVRSGARAEELKNLILTNDANGIREILLSSKRMSRRSIKGIRRAYIGPASNPIIIMQPEPGPCASSSGMLTYLIGGVLVGQYYDNGCVPQG